MNDDWFVRQFGHRDHFAVSVSLGHDPHPNGPPSLDATWGGLSLWVRGRCLTRSISSESGVTDEVRWHLLGILEWLVAVGVRLVNEEPFPHATRIDHVRDGCAWFDETETPLVRGTKEEEQRWFLARSDWRQHHALRRAAADVALPNVVIRRLGDLLEVSWDNETWGVPHAGLSFVEQRGTELVAAPTASAALLEAMRVVTGTLVEEKAPELAPLANAAEALAPNAGDWRFLVHRQSATVIRDEMPELEKRLSSHVRKHAKGLYIPHTPETLALRQVRLASGAEIKAFLAIATVVPQGPPMKDAIQKLVARNAAPSVRPWVAGYERALDVREALGWKNDPAPELSEWLSANGVHVDRSPLASSIDVIASRTDDERAVASVNPQGGSLLGRETGFAAALGHIVMDESRVAVDGAWEHWPTAARARAFAWMLLLPEEGIRDVLDGTSQVDAEAVKRVMTRFHTGPYATTYHLKNLRFIADDERRFDILRELVA